MIRLTVERKLRGWSQTELGRKSGVNPVTISLIESRRLKPGATQIEKLRVALGIRAADAARLLETVEVEPLAVAGRQ